MQRAIQFVFLGSVAALALCGVVALFSDRTPLLAHLIQTSAGFAVTGGIWMAAWRAWRGGRLKPIPLATLLVGTFALAAFMAAIWSEPFVDETVLWAMLVVAVTGGLLSTLALADLRPRYVWVRVIAYLSVATTAGCAIFFLTQMRPPVDGRLWGLSSILAATGFVVTPILHRVSERSVRSGADRGPYLVRCPHCGHKLPSDPSEVF